MKRKSGSWWGGYGANTYDLDMMKSPLGYHIWGSLGKLGCRVRISETADGLGTTPRKNKAKVSRAFVAAVRFLLITNLLKF